MDRDTRQAICFILLAIEGVLAMGLVIHFWVVGYPSAIYDINKARGWIDRAITTTDLNKQNVYLTNALAEIEQRNGNPAWWYPTRTTDFSTIKANIEQNIERNSEVAGLNATDYAYQRLIENNLRTYPTINANLGACADWVAHRTLTNIIMLGIFCIVFVALFVGIVYY